MIIYDNKKHPSLQDFGIMIPIAPDKVGKIVDYFKDRPDLAEKPGKILKPLKNIKITKKDLLRAHSEGYVKKLYSKKLTDEIIRSFELVDKDGGYNRYEPDKARYPLKRHFKTILRRVSGTYQSCRNALTKGFCFYLGGGMHHAKKDYGEGFCLVNDIVIALRKLQYEKRIKTVWIIDLDAHKGDGTASLTEDDDSIITLSIHMEKGWPLDKPMYDENGFFEPSYTPSDFDIPVTKGDDRSYNDLLKKGLESLAKYNKPDLALVLSGSDPYELDELESAKELKLTLDELLARDIMVYDFLDELNISKAYIMAGGYGKESWRVYTNFFNWLIKHHF